MSDSANITINGLENVQEALERMPRAFARGVLRKAMISAARIWRDEMALRAPKLTSVKFARNAKNVRIPGDLSRHIMIQSQVNSDLEGEVRVGPSKRVFWANFLEFGTAKMRARPFIRPAFESKASAVMDRFVEECRNILRGLLHEGNEDQSVHVPNYAAEAILDAESEAARAALESSVAEAESELGAAQDALDAEKAGAFDPSNPMCGYEEAQSAAFQEVLEGVVGLLNPLNWL